MAKRMLWAGPYLQGTIPKRAVDEIEAAEVDGITAQVFWDACHAVKNGELFSLVG